MNTVVPDKPAAGGSPGGSAHRGAYEVARPQGVCVICGRAIAPDEKFMAALRETAAGFERVDCDDACWEKFDRKDVVGFWRTTMPRHEARKKIFVDDEVLCDLFVRLQEAQEPSKLNFRFVLGLILMRKRMLIYESTRQEAGQDKRREIWTVRLRGREDMLDLLNPQLTEEQVMDVSRQLGEILNEEL